MRISAKYDALIIGGGIYGSYLASILSESKKVLLVEKNSSLMRGASFSNQTRIHEGPHYLKSMETARASKTYSDKLKTLFPEIIVPNSHHFYILPDHYNAISEDEFLAKCDLLSVSVKKVNEKILNIPHRVFDLMESNYDPSLLRESIIRRLNFRNLEIKLSSFVVSSVMRDEEFSLTLSDNSNVTATSVYNTTYVNINDIDKLFDMPLLTTVTEFVEIPVIYHRMFKKKAMTVIDGPFLSLTPFGSTKLHNLTSVVYSHHSGGSNLENRDTYINFIMKQFKVMVLPAYQDFVLHGSILSKKITLLHEDHNDSRPLVIRRNGNYTQILGTKVGNILEMSELIND